MILGDFKGNLATNTIIINPTYLPSKSTDLYIDDVSVIELNLPAFAGHDISIFARDSVFLGREPDVGIDEACIWYQLTSPTTSVALDTIAGFWVSPLLTSTYVVRHEICGLVKWDTVTIYLDAVGLVNLRVVEDDIKLFPNPASDLLEIFVSNSDLLNDFKTLSIYNNLGQLVREEVPITIGIKNKKINVKTTELKDGMYFSILGSDKWGTVSKRFVISR